MTENAAERLDRLRAEAEPRDRDEVLAEGRWLFDEEVTSVFDDMLSRSIPQYQTMRSLVFDVGSRFVKPLTSIVDLGASRGEALAPFVDAFAPTRTSTFVALEVSEPMLDVLRKRFPPDPVRGVSILPLDLRTEFHPFTASLTLSVLTLMFVPIEYRQRVVENVYRSLVPGGAFILVEKLIGGCGQTDRLFEEIYLATKANSGYTAEQIERKKLSLEGVLVPISAEWNESLLRRAGFRVVEPFWRWANFGAWVAVK